MMLGNLQQTRRLVKAFLCVGLSIALGIALVPVAGIALAGSGLQSIAAYADEDADEAARQAAEEEARRLAEEEAARQAAEEEAARQAAEEEARRLAEEEAARQAAEEEAARQAAEEEAARQAAEEEAARRAAEEEAARQAAEQQQQQQGATEGGTTGGRKRTVEEDPNAVNRLDLYATATNADGNWVKPVLDDQEDSSGLRWLKSGIKEKGGRLRLLVCAEWGDGRTFWQYDENWRTLNLKFQSSNTAVATVSSSGIVTATGDGEAVFTVTEQKTGMSAQLGIRVAGQSGAYVTEVAVCDEQGREYGDERITFKDTDNKLNLFVREVFSDGTTASNAPGAPDCNPGALTPITWSVGDSEIGSVNSQTGVFIPVALGSVKVYATASGGDPDVKQGKVRGFVWVVIDDGDYNTTGDVPSDSLTVNVIYDAYDEKNADGSYKYIVKSQYYSIGDLQAIETARCTYTLTRTDGGYVTASGEGIHLLTLIELTGVDISQVKSFTFTANDGVNPGKMTYDFLFGERYYWPNYEFGGNLSGGTSVFPMLAWASDWRDSKSGADDSSADYDNLGGGTCLRLLFGSSGTSDNKTDHSLKYISEMTIRIKGAPDVTSGAGEDGTGDGDESGGAATTGKDGDGSGSGSGAANASSGGATQKGESGTANANMGPVPAGSKNATADAANKPSSSQAQTEQAAQAQEAQGASAEGAQEAASQRWHAYQMLNPNDKSNLQIDDLKDNPLEPWAYALVLGSLVVGALGSGLSFRRRLTGAPLFGGIAYAAEEN